MNYTKEIFSKCLLVLAGGYDILNEENLLYYQHLKELVEKEKLQDSVIFVLSPGLFFKDFFLINFRRSYKNTVIQTCSSCYLYTRK